MLGTSVPYRPRLYSSVAVLNALGFIGFRGLACLRKE